MSTTPDTDTQPSFSISERSGVKAPLKSLLAVLAFVAVAYSAYTTTRADVDRHGGRLTALEAEARNTREVLTRIDERTAEIKRRIDNGRE